MTMDKWQGEKFNSYYFGWDYYFSARYFGINKYVTSLMGA